MRPTLVKRQRFAPPSRNGIARGTTPVRAATPKDANGAPCVRHGVCLIAVRPIFIS